EARSALGPGPGPVYAVETVKDVGKVLGGDADTRVLYDHRPRLVSPADPDGYGPAFGRVLEGVIEQADEDLAKPPLVAQDLDRRFSLQAQSQPLRFRQGLQGVHHPGDQRAQVERCGSKMLDAGIPAAQRQELVGEPTHPTQLFEYAAQQLPVFGGGELL